MNERLTALRMLCWIIFINEELTPVAARIFCWNRNHISVAAMKEAKAVNENFRYLCTKKEAMREKIDLLFNWYDRKKRKLVPTTNDK